MSSTSHMIPKVIYTAFLEKAPRPQHISALEAAWRTLNPEWGFRCITLDNRPPLLNHFEWEQTFRLPEPVGSVARLNLLRYEVLAQHGGVFIDNNHYPLRPLDELLENVTGFCTTVPGKRREMTPHAMSCSVLGCVRNHAAMWHAVRDLPLSVATFRGVWDQSGPGFLTRVIREHGHFRQFVPFHWSVFNLPKADAEVAGAWGYTINVNANQSIAEPQAEASAAVGKPAEVAA